VRIQLVRHLVGVAAEGAGHRARTGGAGGGIRGQANVVGRRVRAAYADAVVARDVRLGGGNAAEVDVGGGTGAHRALFGHGRADQEWKVGDGGACIAAARRTVALSLVDGQRGVPILVVVLVQGASRYRRGLAVEYLA